MVWFVLLHLVMVLVDLVTATRRTDRDKDVEILLLRHQLRLLQRERPRSPRLSRWEKLILAVLTAKLTHLTADARSAGPGAPPLQAGDRAQVASGVGPPQVDGAATGDRWPPGRHGRDRGARPTVSAG